VFQFVVTKEAAMSVEGILALLLLGGLFALLLIWLGYAMGAASGQATPDQSPLSNNESWVLETYHRLHQDDQDVFRELEYCYSLATREQKRLLLAVAQQFTDIESGEQTQNESHL
jgi:hypothetical protein